MIEVQNVGLFTRNVIGSGEFQETVYECNTSIGRHQQVTVVFYPAPERQAADTKYHTRIQATFDTLNQRLDDILAASAPHVKQLADRYDAEYTSDWPSRLKLSLVRVPYDGPVELSLESHSDPVKPVLFNGLDLNLRFDEGWNLLDAWFDG